MIAKALIRRALEPSADEIAEAKRLAERKRVDEFMNKKLAERRAYQTQQKQQKQQKQQLQYPWAVRAMGPGFQNLYDAVGLRKNKPEQFQGR